MSAIHILSRSGYHLKNNYVKSTLFLFKMSYICRRGMPCDSRIDVYQLYLKPMSVQIKKAESKADLKKFAEYPNKLYKGNPYYVPTLVADDCKVFDRKSNAAFDFAEADFFLAYKDGRLVGRVAAILNPKANETWNQKRVRFGWIDFEDDEEVSAALLETVEKWGLERGMTEIEGPLGFTDFDTEGMLVEGFDELGTFITFYNHPYYKEHLERHGYAKKIDWIERRIPMPDGLDGKYRRFTDIVAERNGLRCVRYSRKEIRRKDIGRKLFDLVNRTYCVLYGYSALSGRQIDQYVEQYLSLLNLDFVSFIVDSDENLIAFGVMCPSLSRAFQKAGGRYFPFGWWHMLRSLVFCKTDTIDMLLIAVDPAYQSKGVPAMLIADLFDRIAAAGFKYLETNPELETNFAVQNLWSGFSPRQHRRRRIYGKELQGHHGSGR